MSNRRKPQVRDILKRQSPGAEVECVSCRVTYRPVQDPNGHITIVLEHERGCKTIETKEDGTTDRLLDAARERM